MSPRKAIPRQTAIDILIESGYRCGNPSCGAILDPDILEKHHLHVPVRDGGGNESSNLLPLCPNHHAMYESGRISKEAVVHWKRMLVALNHSFSREAMDLLLFMRRERWSSLSYYTPDGVSRFAGLIVAGLVEEEEHPETPVAVKLAHLPSVFRTWKAVRDVMPIIEERLATFLSVKALQGSDLSTELKEAMDSLPELKENMSQVEEIIGPAVAAWESGDTDWYRPMLYRLKLTQRGEMLVDAWLSGDESAYLKDAGAAVGPTTHRG